MADFELLSTYITIRTRGLREVIRDFGRARQAAQSFTRAGETISSPRTVQQTTIFARQMENARLAMERIRAAGRPVAQQVASLARVQQRLHVLTQNTALSADQLRRTWSLINSITARQEALQRRVNTQLSQAARSFGGVIQAARAAQRAQQQALNAGARAFGGVIQAARAAQRANQQAATTAAAAWANGFRQVAAQMQAVRQAMNSISLEIGFIAPFARLGGNLFRIAGGFRQIAQAAGASATAVNLAGAAGAALGVSLTLIQTGLNLATAAMRAMARVAISSLRFGFQTLLGPMVSFLRVIRQITQNLPLLAGLIGGLLTRSLIRAGQEFQRISSGFQFAFGAGAQAELSRMIALANQLGVPLEAVTENYVRISSAARDAGIAQEDVRNLMQGVGSAAVALGLDVNRVNGLFFAFEQVISKGRLSSEELRRQIGDRLPGAFAIAARSLGVTTAELDTLLERGAINSADFIRAIGTELNRTFGPQAARQVNRITAVINRLQTQFRLLQIDIASRLEPAFVRVLQRVTDLIRAVRESSAFRAFSAFITQQLLIVEANFDRIVQVVRNWVVDMAPSFQRFARLILVVNTVAIGGFLEAVRRLRPVFDTVLTAIERFITRMTGIEFRGLGANLESVIAVAQAIPAVFDVIELRIRSALNVLRVFTDTFVTTGQVVTAPFRAIHQAVTGIVTGLQLTLDTMLRATGLSDRYAGSTERLAEAMERVRDVTQESFDETRVLRFQRVVENVGRRLDPFRLGIVGAFGSLFAAVERVNAATRETVGLTARAQEQQGGTGSIINITELRGVLERSSAERQQQAIASASQGTERNTGLIATHIAALDRKIGELPDLVETLVRTSVLALPGGGIGR